jgi:hypothetical protein
MLEFTVEVLVGSGGWVWVWVRRRIGILCL